MGGKCVLPVLKKLVVNLIIGGILECDMVGQPNRLNFPQKFPGVQ